MLVAIDPAVALPFDLVESKLQIPTLRRGVVSRTALVNRLRGASSFSGLTIIAPAGYGKTTLLSQWSDRDERPFAWISIDERDNDPVVLMRHVAAAVDRIDPLDACVVDALRHPGTSIWTAAVPRLAAAVASVAEPFVVVLDDAHLLERGDSVDALAMIAEHVPDGSTLVVAGRVPPHLPIAALRASGRLLELGPTELALTRREAEMLLQNAGVDLGDDDVAELYRRTEGWAGALYLAALSLRNEEASNPKPLTFGGDDRYVADYLRSEYLSRLSDERLIFLRRTSVLDRMSGPLCDAVLERRDSALELESIEGSNLLLVPLDRQRDWYRYHHLLHDLLRRELAEREPELVPALNRRAADWFEAHGDPESALEHAYASGDLDRVAGIITSIALPVYHSGRVATVERWIGLFDDDERLDRYPAVAVLGAWLSALRGSPADAERWIAAAERSALRGASADSRTWAQPRIAVLRAAMCGNGGEQMLADAEAALAELPADSHWLPMALIVQGAAHMLVGDAEAGDVALAHAADAAETLGARDFHVVAMTERSLLAEAEGDHSAAEVLSVRARELVDEGQLEGYVTSALQLAASARASLRRGRWDEARADLRSAQRLTPFLTYALPWLAVQARLELARAYMALRDRAEAKALLSEIDEILRIRPNLGSLCDQTEELRKQLETMPEVAHANGSGLTGAELRLLPLLATHMSFREIGERLYVSRNTIKTEAISIYRKLGASSRSEAIDRAGELGLLDVAR